MAYFECKVRAQQKIGNRPFITGQVASFYVDPRYADEKGWYDDVAFVRYLGGNVYQVGEQVWDMSDDVRPGYVPPDSLGMDFGAAEIDLKKDTPKE
jgi:hypothetical protein